MMGGGRRMWGLTAYAVIFTIFLYGPVLLMPLFSLAEGNIMAFPIRGWTFQHYVEMVRQPALIAALKTSLRIAVLVSLLSTALAIPAALALTRMKVPGGGGILGFMMLPLVMPSIVVAVALLVIILRIFGLGLSLYTVAAGHVLVCIPFALSVLMSRLEGFDPALEEASRDLGCTPLQTFRRVTLPLAMPGVISALLLGFIISFDEFVISFFLSGTETTLPVYLFSQLRFPDRLPAALALGSLILVCSTLLVILAEVIRARGARSDNPGDL